LIGFFDAEFFILLHFLYILFVKTVNKDFYFVFSLNIFVAKILKKHNLESFKIKKMIAII